MRKNIPGDAITARELIPGAYERRRMVTPRQSNRRAQQRPRLGMRTMGGSGTPHAWPRRPHMPCGCPAATTQHEGTP